MSACLSVCYVMLCKWLTPDEDKYGAIENAGQENAGLEIGGQKLQGVANDGHTIEG